MFSPTTQNPGPNHPKPWPKTPKTLAPTNFNVTPLGSFLAYFSSFQLVFFFTANIQRQNRAIRRGAETHNLPFFPYRANISGTRSNVVFFLKFLEVWRSRATMPPPNPPTDRFSSSVVYLGVGHSFVPIGTISKEFGQTKQQTNRDNAFDSTIIALPYPTQCIHPFFLDHKFVTFFEFFLLYGILEWPGTLQGQFSVQIDRPASFRAQTSKAEHKYPLIIRIFI